jgi:capsular polysaccharide biosynthesis protein
MVNLMNETLEKYSDPPQITGLIKILQAWRILLVAFLLGGFIGAGAYSLFTPPYRAQTIVVIDQNLERSFTAMATDRDIFYFLERETSRLEELVWSDAVLQQVADRVGNVTVDQLRNKVLQLSEPSDGGWRLYAIDKNPDRAKLIANTWADVFETETLKGVQIAAALETAQNQLKTLSTAVPAASPEEIARLNSQINDLQAQTYGINPLAQVHKTQKIGLVVERASSRGFYAFAGGMAGLVIAILLGAVFLKERHA